jgi:large subunit ribosomal protein L32e
MQMADEIRRLIRVRTQKGAVFKRDGFGKKSQLSDSWRKPRGQHNKQREQKKAKGALPKPGFGSPVAVRGMHPSGFYDVLVFTVKDLEGLNPKTQAIRIAAKIGRRKRALIQEQALSSGLKVLNVRESRSARMPEPEPAKAKAEKPEKKVKKKAKPEKKVKKETPPAGKEKKETAKPKIPKKVKAEPPLEEKPKKETKPKVSKAKAASKTEEKPKRSPKPKAKPAEETKPRQKTALKPATKPKKNTGKEVKDNE